MFVHVHQCVYVCVCISRTLAMILIYKSSLKPFSHLHTTVAKTWGQCWCLYVARWLHHDISTARVGYLIHSATSYFPCDVLMVSHRKYVGIQICTSNNLPLYIFFKDIPSLIKLFHWLWNTFEHDNCCLFLFVTERRNHLNTVHHSIVMTCRLHRYIGCYIFLCE